MTTTIGHSRHLSHHNAQVTSPPPRPPQLRCHPGVPTHGDGDAVLVGRHVEDQPGRAVALGGHLALEAVGLDGDTRGRGLVGVGDVNLEGTPGDTGTLRGDVEGGKGTGKWQ